MRICANHLSFCAARHVSPLLKPGLVPSIGFFGTDDTRSKPPAAELPKGIKANGEEETKGIRGSTPNTVAGQARHGWRVAQAVDIRRCKT
jgi:hypothetical protein